jgi:group I intron endonuclease
MAVSYLREVWKDIVGYEGKYQISNLGNVKSLQKEWFNQFGAKISQKEKILKPVLDKRNDVYMVSLYKDNTVKRYSIARLVGLHFLPLPENNRMVVAHIDSTKKYDNSINNLMWNIINKCRAKKTNKLREIIKNTTPIVIDVDKASGIYKISNIINGKFYIGSSEILLKRLMTHFWELRINKHANNKLQRSYNKYGEGNFKIDIIEFCEKDQCLIREQHYLDTLNPPLNISKLATGGSVEYHSEESKLKMSIAKKEWFENLSEEGKEKRRNIISKSNFDKLSKIVKQYSIDGKYITSYKGLKNAALSINGNKTIIGWVCQGKRNTAYNYKWSY